MYGVARLLVLSVLASALNCMHEARAAEDLKLRDGLSFYQDLDTGFPITGEHMEDAVLDNQHPTLVFFGASGDYHTNRQARRVVELYKKHRAGDLKFVIIDVDHPASAQCRDVLKTYYRGYVPHQVMLDRSGRQLWSQIGEMDLKMLEANVQRVLR